MLLLQTSAQKLLRHVAETTLGRSGIDSVEYSYYRVVWPTPCSPGLRRGLLFITFTSRWRGGRGLAHSGCDCALSAGHLPGDLRSPLLGGITSLFLLPPVSQKSLGRGKNGSVSCSLSVAERASGSRRVVVPWVVIVRLRLYLPSMPGNVTSAFRN